MHRRTAAFAAASLALLFGTLSFAQTLPPQVRAEMRADGDLVRLSVDSSGKASAKLRVGKAKAKKIHKGDAAGTVIVGHEKAIVALAVDHASAPFRVFTVDGKDPGKAARIKRAGDRSDDYPFAVVGTATPDGFTVFFQEIQTDDPSAAHTYMVQLDKDGKPSGDTTKVAVPWALADAIWNGSGYHLALTYSGDRNGMRLSMVSLTEAGQPEQHPDWASRAGFISDVHLFAQDGKIHAFYRGGPSGDRLERSDVTAIRQWGSEPPKAKDLGKMSFGKVIAITDKGVPKKVAGR